MVVGVSKRQQLRNERALQDLIRTIPGNDRCADCQTMNPGWASWNLGVFLCMRCAALHRKMGTHISKVKSLSMDSWSAEQVDNMKSHGNTIVNKLYNPKNIKPPIPVDVDEADSAMERFIRQKYQHRSLEDGKPKPPSRQSSGYTRSPEGSPPPLPPKSGKFSGLSLRPSASASNLNRSSVYDPGVDPSFKAKLATLKDMGFPDDKRNATILRGLSGDLEKAIESLVRLGEGTNPRSRSRTPVPASPAVTAESSSQTAAASTNPFDRLDSVPAATQPKGQSYNPFDVPTAQPQPPQPPQPLQPATTLESSFQHLQVSSQPLFPNVTGGYPNRQNSAPAAFFQQPLTPPVTSTYSQDTLVSSPQMMSSSYNPFFQPPTQTSMRAASLGNVPATNLAQTNPFFAQTSLQNNMSSAHAQNLSQATSWSQQTAPQQPNFGGMSTASPFQRQPSAQPSYNPFDSRPPGQQNTQQQVSSQQNQVYSQFGFQSPQPVLAPQQTSRLDKGSILSLYNLSPSLSAIPEHQQQQQQQPPQQPQQTQPPLQSYPPQSASIASPVPTLTGSIGSTPQTQQSSSFTTPQVNPPTATASMSAGTSRNPYMTGQNFTNQPAAVPSTNYAGVQSGLGIGMGMDMNMGMNMGPGTKSSHQQQSHNPFPPRTHMSQQSIDISGFQNGRHSPDAFAGLSARYS